MMDYVKETLQRQRAAWAALFSGGEETGRAEDGPSARRETREEFAGSRSRQAEERQTSVERQAGALSMEELSGKKTLFKTEEAAQVERLGMETMQADRGRERLLHAQTPWLLPERNGPVEAVFEESAAGTGTLEAEAAYRKEEHMIREERMRVEAADARAISRRFERDARRYDGGFVFY